MCAAHCLCPIVLLILLFNLPAVLTCAVKGSWTCMATPTNGVYPLGAYCYASCAGTGMVGRVGSLCIGECPGQQWACITFTFGGAIMIVFYKT